MSYGKLQWGRRSESAVSTCCKLYANFFDSFNGAADLSRQ